MRLEGQAVFCVANEKIYIYIKSIDKYDVG